MTQFKRGTHCRNGHPYPPNCLPGRDGNRRCPVCAEACDERRKAYNRKKWSEGEGRDNVRAIGDDRERLLRERAAASI